MFRGLVYSLFSLHQTPLAPSRSLCFLLRFGCLVLSGFWLLALSAGEPPQQLVGRVLVPVKHHRFQDFTSSFGFDQTVPHAAQSSPAKYVSFPLIAFSSEKKLSLRQRLSGHGVQRSNEQAVPQAKPKRMAFSNQHDLGMDGLPVMDQGMHGTCATFANTAGVNALFHLHDEAEMSPLCQLQLSRTLRSAQAMGDWNGSLGVRITNDLMSHGFLSKQYQHAQGCGGLTHYPMMDPAFESGVDMGKAMPVNLFDQNSDRRFHAANRVMLMNPFRDDEPTHETLTAVKSQIDSGHRVVLGYLLDLHDSMTGLRASHSLHYYDSWIMTSDLYNDIIEQFHEEDPDIGGHEVIITGYDDGACAFTQNGEHQCGLLKIRNSWGEHAGDHGDFYISYDYFEMMAMEVYALQS